MSESKPSEDRLTQLEMLVMHLQRDVESLHSVVLDQQKRIDALQQVLVRTEDRLGRLLIGADGEKFDPQFDRPPHY